MASHQCYIETRLNEMMLFKGLLCILWFLNLIGHQNDLKGLLKHELLDPIPRASIQLVCKGLEDLHL